MNASRTRVHMLELDAHERELLERQAAMEDIVQDTDWFLKSCITNIKTELYNRWYARSKDQIERYMAWKRQYR